MGIFKIFRTAEWDNFQALGDFKGSPDDLRDGFIHFSSEDYLAGTMVRYFKDEAQVVIAKIDNDAGGEAMIWESSRGGGLFPHLYGTLYKQDIVQAWTLSRTAGKAWDLSVIENDLNITFAPSDV